MGQLVNLNRLKKQKVRDVKETRAAENSAKFGRTKGQRVSGQKDIEIKAAHLDGNKREP